MSAGPYDAADANLSTGTFTIYDSTGRVIETQRFSDVEIFIEDVNNIYKQIVGKKTTGWVKGELLSYEKTIYDVAGRVVLTIALDDEGYEQPTGYKYDAAGKQIAIADANDYALQKDSDEPDYAYEQNGDWFVIKQTVIDDLLDEDYIDSLDYVSTTEYEGNRRKSVTDDRGFTTSFTYDALGRVIETKHPSVNYIDKNNTPQTGNLYTYSGYDSLGRKEWQTEPTDNTGALDDTDGLRWFEYDAAGRLTATILAKVDVSGTWYRPRYEYKYDDYGNLEEISDNITELAEDPNTIDYSNKRIIKFTYNELNQKSSRTLYYGTDNAKTEYWYYDELGRVKVYIDFKEQATGYFYNNRGQLQYKCYYEADGIVDGLNQNYNENDPNAGYTTRVIYTYDNLGRKKTVAETRGTTIYHYDIEGRIEQIGTPEGTINYEYNLITGSRIRTYSNNTDTDYFYDILGRLENVKAAEEEVIYGYDAAGNRIWMGFDLDGSVGFEIETNYIYNSINRLTELVHQDTTGQLASYSYSLSADGQRVSLDEEIKLTGGSTESHDIAYGYDNINRLTDETADSSGSGYDVYYEYDLVGNRTLREITVNNQPFTTEYEYYDGTDKLKTETQCGASCMLDIGDERYYAYARQNGKGFYYRDSNGNKIGSFHAFLIGLPSVWSRYLFILVMAMVPVLLLGPAVKRLLFCYGEPTRLRLRVPRKSICILLAFLIFVGPEGFESLAQAEVQYAELGISSWGQTDRTIEYTYDDNGSVETKTTKVTSTQSVEETVTYDYNLANRLEKVTTEQANGDQHIVEYTYNDEGIRVSAYSYDIPYSQGVQNEKTVIYLADSYNHTGFTQTLEELVYEYAEPDPLTETPDSLTTYLIGNDCLAQRVDSTTQYLLYDGHGSTRQLAEYDTSVSLVETFSYDGYGVLLQDETIASQRPGYVSAQATSLLYAGEYFDTSNQSYYLRARWYDSLNGRFNRMDDFSGNYSDPQSLHKYLYCHADPVNNIDPSGLMNSYVSVAVTSSIIGAIAGIIVGGISGGWRESLRLMLIGACMAPLFALSIMFGGTYILAPLLGVKAATGIFITHTAVTAIFTALGIRQFSRAESGRQKAAIVVAIVIMIAFWGFHAYKYSRSLIPARLPQDKSVDPTPPKAKPLDRPISKSPTQNARLQEDIATLKKMGAYDFRVDQHQVNFQGKRVGINKPDLQFSMNKTRFYSEYETSGSTRGPAHSARIKANDPKSVVMIIEQD